mmetsp:Transcript_566/g.1763  ORF Transcript_566/g.1763 Transcript_566/m.1763 type:complete len:235 (+) Transcript_566:164-868(+)
MSMCTAGVSSLRARRVCGSVSSRRPSPTSRRSTWAPTRRSVESPPRGRRRSPCRRPTSSSRAHNCIAGTTTSSCPTCARRSTGCSSRARSPTRATLRSSLSRTPSRCAMRRPQCTCGSLAPPPCNRCACRGRRRRATTLRSIASSGASRRPRSIVSRPPRATPTPRPTCAASRRMRPASMLLDSSTRRCSSSRATRRARRRPSSSTASARTLTAGRPCTRSRRRRPLTRTALSR